MATPKELVRRYGRLLEKRRQWENEGRELARFILPRKSNVLLGATPGQKQTGQLMDSTAIKANEDLASAMQGSLTSTAIRWFSLKMRRKELNDVKEVAVWLEEVADRIHLALQQSNFASEFHEVYLDLGAFGVACILLEERDILARDFNGFRFHAFTFGEYVIEENADGHVDTLFRKFNLSARAAVARWGPERLTKQTQERAADKPDDAVSFLHIVMARPDGEIGLGVPGPRKRWASIYLELGVATPGSEAVGSTGHEVEESGFDEFPFMVPRWTKAADEIYGRGPGHTALPDIKTLNRARELTFKQWAKSIDPPLEILDGALTSKVSLTPAAQNFVLQSSAIKPIESGARFDVNAVEIKELKDAIRRVFFADQLNLPPVQGTPMSATEIRLRFELMERLLGPTLGRLESELLNPLIDRAFGLMLRGGALPPIPDAILQSLPQGGRLAVDVEYEGPLARSQKSSDLDAITRTVEILGPLQAVFPDIMDNVDSDVLARHVMDVTGVPATIRRSEDEVTSLRATRAEAAESEKETAEAATVAETVEKGAAGVKSLAQAAGVQRGQVPGV